MPDYDGSGRALRNSKYKRTAASVTTAQISVSGDGVPGRDYVERCIITYASSAAGTVTLFDGTTAIFVDAHAAGVAGQNLCNVVDVGALAESTQGFNITTGGSVAVVTIGRF